MTRFTEGRYRSRVALAMVLYVVVLLLAWPLVRGAASLPLRVVLALLPTLPVFYVIWQMAQRVRHGDELEQRTHLIALGASTAVVGVASLVGGFLAAAGVVPLDGSILLWVFPLMVVGYQVARWWVVRHYGNEPACAGDEAGIALRWRILLVAGLIAVVGWLAWRRHDAFDTGLFVGMAAAAVLVVLVQGILHWRRRRAAGGQPRDA
ncbi:hypothetical protein [Rhodanobacter denitrificans]|uniref:Uncharacterized protein n=1 Tax=Rhodanobacter denitrificans TaxID=666685 RepID=M4NAG7_9GAMM|nr:hypothetical protein [Rhodanobacter denitrificans]AGG87480.1 hypothetical protein R2APBS1_0304 [Rhodanobacter denitrificans]UJM86660.1 hypothetical protein LRJ86_18085 [Rhodanobacter denitrificans]